MHTKQTLATAVILVLAATLLTASVVGSSFTAEAKKPAQKCNNVKILVKLNNVVNGTEYTVSVTLNNVTKEKTQTAELEDDETSMVVPVSFKKLDPCPAVGDDFSGTVNGGNNFSGEIKSLKKPNKVTVDL